MMELKEELIAKAKEMGVDKVGFTSRNRLYDAPPSGDLGYVLPTSKSAISLLMAFDKAFIRPYLAKKDQHSLNRDRGSKYIRLAQVQRAIQDLLENNGYEVSIPFANFKYRDGLSPMAMAPVAITSVVTSAELEPDPMVEGGDACNKCRLCVKTCPSHYIAGKEEMQTKIGGRIYTHNRHGSNMRCMIGCGGEKGMRSPDAKWSTWSPKMLDLPGLGDEAAFERACQNYTLTLEDQERRKNIKLLINRYFQVNSWKEYNAMVTHMEKDLTCCNCMYICWPDMEDRKENFRLLTRSGRVVEDGNTYRIVHD